MSEGLIGCREVKSLLAAPLPLPHAILLVGPRGCGRNFAARLIAAKQIGTHADWIESGIHPDCITLAGQGASGQIPIKAVREALREISNSPAAGNGRAVLVRDAAALNQSSANALLKSLEEPPQGVVFIFTAEGTSAVPVTVLSRCAVYPVSEVTKEECAARVSDMLPRADRTAINKAIEVFGGRIGLVALAVKDRQGEERLQKTLKLREALISRDKTAVMAITSGIKTREEALAAIGDVLVSLEKAGEAGAAQAMQSAAADIKGNMPLALVFAYAAAGL